MITFVKNNFFPESSKEVLCSWRIKDQRGSRRYFKNSSEFSLLVKCIYITTCHNLQSILLYSQPIAWSRQRLQSLSLKVITVQIEVEWKCYFKTHSENAVFFFRNDERVQKKCIPVTTHARWNMVQSRSCPCHTSRRFQQRTSVKYSNSIYYSCNYMARGACPVLIPAYKSCAGYEELYCWNMPCKSITDCYELIFSGYP